MMSGVTRYTALAALGISSAILAAGWVFYGSDLISGEVTSYYATCLQRSPDNHCTAIGRTFEPAVFRVSAARQQVESVGQNGQLRPLRSCVVTSKREWRCRSTDDAFELGVSAGRPWQRIQGKEASDLVFLPRWRYLWVRSGEPQGPSLLSRRFLLRR
jgi:hypothetical protein